MCVVVEQCIALAVRISHGLLRRIHQLLHPAVTTTERGRSIFQERTNEGL